MLLLLGKVQRGFYIAELLSLAKNLYAQLICLFDNLCELTCIKSPKALVGAVRRHHKLLISTQDTRHSVVLRTPYYPCFSYTGQYMRKLVALG